MKIVVIDGQGGGLGKAMIERIRSVFADTVEISAVGTNSLATASMIKAGADRGATGENAIVVNSRDADIIIGPIAIILCDSLMGEISSKIVKAVARSKAVKILIPVSRCGVKIAGVALNNMNQLIDDVVKKIKEYPEN